MIEVIASGIYTSIQDNGRGISKEDLPNVFNRYFQTTNPDAPIEGGTGIGLALTKELLGLMNGRISVQSTVGEGTEFEIRLPIVETLNYNVCTKECNVCTEECNVCTKECNVCTKEREEELSSVCAWMPFLLS